PIGQVVDVSPEERKSVPPGSTVTLFVSQGVYVPDVVGLSVSEAQADFLPEALWDASISEAKDSTAEFDTIVAQDPKGDTYTDELGRGNRVKIELIVAPPSQKLIAALAAKLPTGGRGAAGGGAAGGGTGGATGGTGGASSGSGDGKP